MLFIIRLDWLHIFSLFTHYNFDAMLLLLRHYLGHMRIKYKNKTSCKAI